MSSPCQIELRSMKNALRELSDNVKNFIAALDVEMKKPNALDRGTRVAIAANALDLSNKKVRRFSLGLGAGR